MSTHISGSSNPVVLSTSSTRADKNSCTVEVAGVYEDLKALQGNDSGMKAICPSGFEVESSTCTPDGSGNGRLSIRCVNYGADDISTSPTRVTYHIDLAEVKTDLKSHPHVVDQRITIEKWLATDADKRFADDGNPQYVDAEGTAHSITDETVKKFCAAYSKGIETYNRYFPIIEKISYYKRVPGLSMSGNSITGGTARFSNIGTFNAPDINLQGYASAGWYKSKDSYSQGNDRVWTRTEQWTWTPDYNDQDVNWIYGGGEEES